MAYAVDWPYRGAFFKGIRQTELALLFGLVALRALKPCITSNMALMVFALLMWSVLTSDVSMVPGCGSRRTAR